MNLSSFILLSYLLIINSSVHCQLPTDVNSVTLLLQHLVSTRRFDCTVFFVRQELISDGWKSKVNTVFQDLIKLNVRLHVLNLESSVSLEVQKDIRHFTPYCSLVIYACENVEQGFSKHFLNILAPPRTGITQRDEDHYVFIANNESTATSLLQSEISSKLRYKIAVYEDSNRPAQLAVKTLCIYCKSITQGQGQIIGIQQNEDLFPDFTANFRGHAISMSCPTRYMAMYQMHQINNTYRHKRGFHTVVFQAVQDRINLTYTLKPCSKFGKIPEGAASGTLLPNGTWAGCMGDVLYERVDMAMSVSPDDKRINFVEFTIPIEYTWLTFTTSQPKVVHSWKIIFKPFTRFVWGAIGMSTVIIAGVIIFSEIYFGSKRDKIQLTKATSMALIASLLTQATVLSLSTRLAKAAFIVWLMYTLIIATAYASKLTAFITSPGAEFVPKTFEELVNSDYSWGASRAFRDGLGDEVFKRSTNPTMRQIYFGMDVDKDDTDCTARAAHSKYACFAWEVMQQFSFKTVFSDRSGNHPFSVADDTAFFVSMNYITRKKEIFRSHFNNVIRQAYNTGLIKQWIKLDWRSVKEERLGKQQAEKQTSFSWTRESGPKAFTVQNLQGSFFILQIGFFAGTLIFCIEQLFKKFLKKVKNLRS